MPVFLGTLLAIVTVFSLMGKLHKLGRGPRRVFGQMMAPRRYHHYPLRHWGCGPSCGCSMCQHMGGRKKGGCRKQQREGGCRKQDFRRKQYARLEKATPPPPPSRQPAPVRTQLPRPPATTAPRIPVPATGGPVTVTPWPSRAPFEGCYS